tara:strand:+ start:486 stop:1631 length:1146 start_codon:yes stop_codon:yes gene_type:complete
MKKSSVFYWCPFISKVATVKAVINSALSLNKYSKGEYNPTIINSFGEWDELEKDLSQKKICLSKKLINFKFLKLDLKGFLFSRIKYFIIFIIGFFPLMYFLKKNKPNYLIIHLVTSLPLVLFSLVNFQTKLILRISGLPKLNFHRKILWRFASKNIYKITCPTKETYERLKKIKEFESKVYLLRDPILISSEICSKRKKIITKQLPKNDFILSIGRLTKQKNYEFLINNFAKINLKNLDLLIIGNGELKGHLIKKIKELNIDNKVYFIDIADNVFQFLNQCKYFVMTSLWEDPGFVLVEAAFMNKTILSSNCPSGPREILSEGKGGFLFKSNDSEDFIKQFNLMTDTSKSDLLNKQINAKNITKEFTTFRHYKNLKKLLII